MHKGQTLISAIQLSTIDKQYINLLLKSEITAIAFEFIKDENGILSLIRSISEIAGNTAILIAAEYLSNVNSGKGLMLGGRSWYITYRGRYSWSRNGGRIFLYYCIRSRCFC